MSDVFLGIDVGTSGVRAIAVDGAGKVAAEASTRLPPPDRDGSAITQDPGLWWEGLRDVLAGIAPRLEPERLRAIAIDGTSGTLLVADSDGTPLAPAGMYNDASAADQAPRIREHAPAGSAAHGATSPLGRLLHLQARFPEAAYALHQADWLAARLTGRWGLSDANNALKLGFDPVAFAWPDWMDGLGVRRRLLPEVRDPGTPFAPLDPAVARALGLSSRTLVVAGTTDGCASFLATGAAETGDGVTALGSTLTLKLLSDDPVFDASVGVYSHRLQGRWLVGGASNTGGAALLRFFDADRIRALTGQVDPERPLDHGWHPLPGTGERFPVADPAMTFDPDRTTMSDAAFFQGLLEGIAAVEARAYRLLHALGGPELWTLRSVGGGASSAPWTRIRARHLGADVAFRPPLHAEAAYGAALLARAGAAHG
ncbi:FGGY-family carbohydrate kinase [Marinivivus vitaminiproducens]|uniref:FGGY-family carbohydrate kinase n=1 Tax=Marinivivus vitaminiproducens TaxID=3035935 RepID=UPI0027A1FF85|nr:FGGY-family carbohydrate kinase [Geminicoccaceae bacterium SCSIO 64248]